jgi:hypothetical protein
VRKIQNTKFEKKKGVNLLKNGKFILVCNVAHV